MRDTVAATSIVDNLEQVLSCSSLSMSRIIYLKRAEDALM